MNAGVKVVVYDPAAMENATAELAGNMTFARSAADCARQADVLAITTPWTEFRALSPADLKPGDSPPVVLDCWRMLDPAGFADRAVYLTLGAGTPEPKHEAAIA